MFSPKYQAVNEHVTLDNQHQCLLRRITPFYNKPYKVELAAKQQGALNIINTIKQKLLTAGTNHPNVEVEDIFPSVSKENTLL